MATSSCSTHMTHKPANLRCRFQRLHGKTDGRTLHWKLCPSPNRCARPLDLLRYSIHFSNESHLCWIGRFSVLPEDVMEPNGRLSGIGFFPRIPRINGLRFPVHESPIVGRDVFLL